MPKVNEYAGALELLADMKQRAHVKGIHFHDFLQDFDRQRLNEIIANQFGSGAVKSEYRLANAEFQALVRKYSSPTRDSWMQ
jgi:hypothetical protein